MQAQKNLVEQQLQETAGDLVQAERELSRTGVRTPGAESSRGIRPSGNVSIIEDLEKELSKYKQDFDSIMTVCSRLDFPSVALHVKCVVYWNGAMKVPAWMVTVMCLACTAGVPFRGGDHMICLCPCHCSLSRQNGVALVTYTVVLQFGGPHL